MNKRKKLIAALMAVVMTASTGCSLEEFFNPDAADNFDTDYEVNTTYMHELDPEIHELVADTNYKTIGNKDGVVFETALTEDEIASGTPVGLFSSSNAKLSDLYDDGTNGDRIAGDGIYTCRYTPEVSSETEENYNVKIGDFVTDPVSVRFFDEITQQDFDDLKEFENNINDLTSQYKDKDGNIPDDKFHDALTTVANEAELMVQNGEAVSYSMDETDNVVSIKLSSGIRFVYIPPSDEYKNESASADTKLTIMTCEPCNFWFDNSDKGAKIIAKEFDHISFTENYDGESVTRETIKKFKPNQIIILSSHGGHSPENHSFVRICEKYDKISSSDDCIEERVISLTSGYVGFTYKFIDAYCGDLSNTYIYLGCCSGAKDGVLASSFMKKNCNVLLGYNETVKTKYDNKMLKSIPKYLSKKKKNNGGYYTIGEALSKARKDNGKNDGSKLKTTHVLFGNSSYKLSDAVDDNLQIVTQQYEEAKGSIKIDKTYVSISTGDTATVSITEYPAGYSASDFIWSIDKTEIASVSGGNITGKKAGSAVLKIESTDHKYTQFCAVKVN